MRSILRLVMLAGVIATGAVACAPRVTEPSPTTPTQTIAAATTSVPTTGGTTLPANAGAISGLFGYPAESNPAVTIYAVSTADRGVFFSVAVPRGTAPKPAYTITGVRPGTYYLLAYTDGNDGPAGGAYTEYVKCGLKASCSDHTLIGVTVGAGQTVRDIEVSDWYAPAGTFPVRPR